MTGTELKVGKVLWYFCARLVPCRHDAWTALTIFEIRISLKYVAQYIGAVLTPLKDARNASMNMWGVWKIIS